MFVFKITTLLVELIATACKHNDFRRRLRECIYYLIVWLHVFITLPHFITLGKIEMIAKLQKLSSKL